MLKLSNRGWLGVTLVISMLCLGVTRAGWAKAQAEQSSGNTSQTSSQDQQNIPDAPSATRPPKSSPASLPSAPQPQPSPNSTPPIPPLAKTPAEQPPAEQPASPPPQPAITSVPAGGAPDVPSSPRDKLYTYTANVNFVVVPVTVKDDSGRLVDGLLAKDFSVYENGEKQLIKFFTSDPFPLSAAVIIDTGVPNVEFRKVKESLTAIEGAFSQFDEVSLYVYSNVVQRMLDFSAVNKKLDATLSMLRDKEEGETGGVPFQGGPLNSRPTINGLPVDQGAMASTPPPRMSHVLNDALLQAAVDLSRRDRTRRKVIFIISNGNDWGSTASYREVLKFLLSHNVSVYAVAVSGSALPGYSTAEKLRIPGLGTSNILPKYAAATGGQVFPAFTQRTMEQAYAELTREARNQYTIGYTARATVSSGCRDIEVRVDRPSLKVAAKYGYCPLPPGR